MSNDKASEPSALASVVGAAVGGFLLVLVALAIPAFVFSTTLPILFDYVGADFPGSGQGFWKDFWTGIAVAVTLLTAGMLVRGGTSK